jgi:hypothetical protein
MAFREQIALIPFHSTQREATGILAPLVRSMGHVLYACAALADGGYTIEENEVQYELNHAASHLSTSLEQVHRAPLSQRGKDLILHYVEAVHNARDEFPAWNTDDRISNLKDLANRAAALAAFLDAECIGLRDSQPGSSL